MGLFGFIFKHTGKIIAGAAVIGAGAAAAGAVNASKAKKLNKEAEAIRDKAMQKYNQMCTETDAALKTLGETELEVIDKFPIFCDYIERIQGRPELSNEFKAAPIDIPKYNLKDIKQLPSSLGMALAGVAGAGTGALIGLAAFGASAVVAAPAMIGGGIVLCAKGVKLKKQAVQNVKQAQLLSEQVDEVCDFYSKVLEASNTFNGSLKTLNKVYDYHLKTICPTVQRKTYWYEYTSSEKRWVENTILITGLLYEMCKTTLVTKAKEVEVVNEKEVYQLKNKSMTLIKSLG